MPRCKDLFKFSATQKEDVDFRYSLGEAIEQGVLSDYDLTVPVTTQGHPYICLANLLLTQAGRFRRVLAYCNSVKEAERFQQVLDTVGLAAWHINAMTNGNQRERVMEEFSGELQKPVHVLVTVQVLGEGVNIPNADTCMFVEPRDSYVSIIQAIGRVLRPHPSKPMAHIVLPAIAMPATSRSAGMAPPGLSDFAAGAQSIARKTGSVEQVPSPQSELDQGSVHAQLPISLAATTRSGSKNFCGRELTAQTEETSNQAGNDEVPIVQLNEPAQNELLPSGDRLHAAVPCTEAAQWAGCGNATTPRPCDSDSRSPSRTSMTCDRHRAEFGPCSLPAPAIPMMREFAPVVPVRGTSEDAPVAMPASVANTAAGSRSSRMGTSANDHHDAERARRQSSLPQHRLDSLLLSCTGQVPASTTALALDAAALAACKREGACGTGNMKKQSTASRDAAARGMFGAQGPSASARDNRIDSGAGPPSAGLRDCRRDPTGLKDAGSQGDDDDGAKPEFSGPKSQSPASMTDGRQAIELHDGRTNDKLTAFHAQAARPPHRSPSKQLPAATRALDAAPGTKPTQMVPRHHATGSGPSMKSRKNVGSLMQRRASKLKVNTAGNAGNTHLSRGCHADQLDRFLQAIAQADSRLVEKDIRQLQCRLWVMDIRLQQPNMPQLLARDVVFQLALVLHRRDAWDLRLQAVEKFEQEHGRLPRQISNQLGESTLGKWLHNTCCKLKRQAVSAERMQKLLNSSCSRLRGRVAKWLESDSDASFQRWLEELRRFVHVHRRMPRRGKACSMPEKLLMKGLLQHVQPANRKREKRFQLLENVDPIVADWVKSRQARKIQVNSVTFRKQLDRLVKFVGVNARLPQPRLGELDLYRWLSRQRRQLDQLPAEYQAKLIAAHPAIAAFLES
ncbi:irc3 [Symbiodinium sp. CCMP2456]|nr:irc3 [Symbiodinium sp. CCMP2456]